MSVRMFVIINLMISALLVFVISTNAAEVTINQQPIVDSGNIVRIITTPRGVYIDVDGLVLTAAKTLLTLNDETVLVTITGMVFDSEGNLSITTVEGLEVIAVEIDE